MGKLHSFLRATCISDTDPQTWEDPDVDVKKLGINKNDHVLAITSAGDNVLHYALAAHCERIHAVGKPDLPCGY